MKTFHMPVLHRAAWLNVAGADAAFDAPGQVVATGDLRPIVQAISMV